MRPRGKGAQRQVLSCGTIHGSAVPRHTSTVMTPPPAASHAAHPRGIVLGTLLGTRSSEVVARTPLGRVLDIRTWWRMRTLVDVIVLYLN